MSLANDLLKEFEPDIQSITLIPSDGGQFEVIVNQKTIFSKLEINRHAEPGEVVALFRKFIRL